MIPCFVHDKDQGVREKEEIQTQLDEPVAKLLYGNARELRYSEHVNVLPAACDNL